MKATRGGRRFGLEATCSFGFGLAVFSTTAACGTSGHGFETIDAPREAQPPGPAIVEDSTSLVTVQATAATRIESASRFMLALRLGDFEAVALLLTPGCKLTFAEQSQAATGRTVVEQLRTVLAQHASPSEGRGAPMFDYQIRALTETSPQVEVLVRGAPGVKGRWTLTFSEQRASRIREIRLPPPQ